MMFIIQCIQVTLSLIFWDCNKTMIIEMCISQVKNTANSLHTCKDNKVVIRDKPWYNKYRYKVEVWRNWRDTGFKEETLKEAHKFIQQSFDFNASKTRRMPHYNAYSIPLCLQMI